MTDAKSQKRMVRFYNRAMVDKTQRRYYGDSGFYNFGYWGSGAGSQREASEALVDVLLARIPERRGRILDVACGLGATTKRLLDSYPPENVAAINISEFQAEQARARAPGCDIRVMDATKLDFPDASFDAVICVEAAFHFETRDAFLREALRVLKPGGFLVLSDILVRRVAALVSNATQLPRANFVPDIESYRDGLRAAGFVDVDARDATDECLGGFRRSLTRWAGEERRAGRMKLDRRIAVAAVSRAMSLYFAATCKTYLLVSARKPA